MSNRPIAYVMEQTLGNVTHYLNLRRHEGAGGEARPRWLPIEYRRGTLPWTVTGSLLARQALTPVMGDVDGVFIHTTTLAPLVVDRLRRTPAVVSCDGTPMNKRHMRQEYGLQLQGRLQEQAKRALYRGVFARCVGFVGWSTWARQSYIEDYGCPEDRVAVIPPGVDLEQFGPGDRNHAMPRLLFVGGDFVRKGGDLLLDVFRRRLRGRAELILVTRDEIGEEPGVTVHRNVQANSPTLRQLYATSDVFVIPTRADMFSIVAMEALASGLPVVATRVGGIPDIVLPGETGHIIEPDDPEALGDALERLVTDPATRTAMGLRAREDAMRRFGAQDNARRLFEFVRRQCELG
jgi:glycosyltransferase involved in cell wall biosynthesis